MDKITFNILLLYVNPQIKHIQIRYILFKMILNKTIYPSCQFQQGQYREAEVSYFYVFKFNKTNIGYTYSHKHIFKNC